MVVKFALRQGVSYFPIAGAHVPVPHRCISSEPCRSNMAQCLPCELCCELETSPCKRPARSKLAPTPHAASWVTVNEILYSSVPLLRALVVAHGIVCSLSLLSCLKALLMNIISKHSSLSYFVLNIGINLFTCTHFGLLLCSSFSFVYPVYE